MEKKCSSCQQIKPLEEFHRAKNKKDGRQHRCAECATTANIARYKERREQLVAYQAAYDSKPENKLKSRIQHIVKVYRVSKEEATLLASADTCEICKRSGLQMHVDHDHATGRVRGVLCQNCNLSLGGFQESIESLEKAIWYLKNK